MHSPEIRTRALTLVEGGCNDCETSRRLGVPRSTVRDWRRPSYQRKADGAQICPSCWRASRTPIRFTDADYAELLGLYLGDGHIARTGRSDRLRIFLDTKYQGIVWDAHNLLARSFPGRRVGMARTAKGTTTIVSVYCTHLACLFPQHGLGKKHERTIRLESWQRGILERTPWPFLRGCIRSDGCVFLNRTGRQAYLSYDFTNRSADILRLFTEACELVGVEYRAYEHRIRIYQRRSVELMLHHVGRKA